MIIQLIVSGQIQIYIRLEFISGEKISEYFQ